MRYFKTFALTLYFFIGILIPACDWVGIDDDCNCGGTRFFNVIDLRVDAFKDISSSVLVTPGERLFLDEFEGFYLDYEVDYHACANPRTDWSLSLMNTAWACSCAVGYDGSKNEGLIDLTVTTVNDFDDDHLAGSSINDLLQYRGSFWETDDLPFPEFLEEEKADKLRFEDMKLSLLKAPEIDSVFQVQIRMELSTGEVYEASSPAFVILE